MTITKKVTRGVKISSGLVLLGVIAGTFLGNWLPKFDGGDGVIPVQGSKPDLSEKTTPPPRRGDPNHTCSSSPCPSDYDQRPWILGCHRY